MHQLYNLIVDLDDRFALSPHHVRALARSVDGVEIATGGDADDATLAWIDAEFGGGWSSEAHAGTTITAFRNGMPIGFATFDPRGLRYRWLRGLGRERDVGVFGPFGVTLMDRKTGLGKTLLQLALAGLRERGYARALIAAVGDERLVRYYTDAVNARVAERFDRVALAVPRARALVMASGNGSNFQAVVDGVRSGALPIDVIGLLANAPKAFVIERARSAAVPALTVSWSRNSETRAQYDARLLEAAVALKPDLVLLLGWMHVLDEAFVRAFADVINVHPAFLPLDPERDEVGLPDRSRIPAFRGAFAVRDAVAAGSSWIGATVHAVTPRTDRGPVLVRKPLRLLPEEDAAHAIERLHPIEHRLVADGIMRLLYERSAPN